MPNNTQWPWRDGIGLVKLSDALYMFGGWNPSEFPSPYRTNQVWKSTDNGANWTQLADAPWTPRHSFGYGKIGDTIWLWGGDYLSGVYQKEIYTFTAAGGWVQVTSDWGSVGGDRVIFAFCVHQGEIYMAGGQTDYSATPTMFTDIVKWNGSAWQVVGTLPISYFSTGAMVSDGTNLYIMGGGRYLPTVHDNLNTKCYKSANGGANWSEISTLPAAMNGYMYCNAEIIGDRIFYVNGYSVADTANKIGTFSAVNGLNWGLYKNTLARHGAGICTDVAASTIYVATGNEVNDVFKIVRTSV